MKFFLSFIILTFSIFFASCDDIEIFFPKTTFDNPFPKNNLDLTKILGDNLTLKSGADTLSLKIFSSENYNLITNQKNGDTLFIGTVCKFHGLYYFSQQLNDSSYWIYAVKVSDNLVYGINSAFEQTLLIDKAINANPKNKMVKFISVDKIRLHPDKRNLKNLFSAIIDSISPDTILNFKEVAPLLSDTTKNVEKIDAEEFKFLSKVYPNPTTDYLNIEFQQKNKFNYYLTDLSGKRVLQGQLSESKSKIDLSMQKPGIYYLTLNSSSENWKETTKIVKTE